ncbi:hypothetical protein FGW37_27850 [Streptomyces rectiverticillatus]|uniref:hypothetical protein n=1 Tax=Streptomyces rectiverticillatus TaxID=173860 RepID=UPI0015C37B06|nr:hypothetical protein [Streptomyces rectiverticillatus]QLE74900.1 hypothetical protein FGW37_27850 [Streptomyces rectiverticillatus]
MAFSNLGPPTTLPANTQTRWEYWLNAARSDFGLQTACADIKSPNQGAWHVARDQGKRREDSGRTTYTVIIVNQGPGAATHNLQGGGGV